MFDNLTKFIVWTIPTNIGEGLVILTAIAAGVVLPITPLQILWINMTTAVLLGMTLAFEPNEGDLMERPPRDPKLPLLSSELVLRTIFVSLMLLGGAFGLHALELARGASHAEARTVAANVFVVVEAFYLLNCRSLLRSIHALGFFTNMWVWGGIGAMAALQLLFTYLPVMNVLFGTAPIDAASWARILGVGFAASALVGAEKAVRRRTRRSGDPSVGESAAGSGNDRATGSGKDGAVHA